jgi:hypothetical protein
MSSKNKNKNKTNSNDYKCLSGFSLATLMSNGTYFMKGGGGRLGTDDEAGEFQPDDENVRRGGGDDDDDGVTDGLATRTDGSITTVVLIGLKDR